ncbi:SGNH/GDSL hydrolase family protein [Modestobacter sp. VKM Ac-2985]|uniref:SGNH/GDSL hydrolase family protein n=1 Tax=Modestobacter sp. VKM Ac-2985 TaxID=3004139 RepID=UPI0022AB601D|nr:SGNH/GDSL hydrolase family protein [Modestobacter sp. VKM Ac-2985]MCZ2838578.1 SGNH/GDSL hydrolase family protein [Modestobacter sp. VKM Ac-2985]
MRSPTPVLLSVLSVLACVGCGLSTASGSAPSGDDARTTAADSRVVVLGDSYTVDSAEGAGYVPLVSEAMGWATVLEAEDGTGYLAGGLAADPAPYRERLDDVVAGQPDLVLVQGSTNDVGHPVAELRAAADHLYAALAARLPDARVVVLGPVAPPGVDPAGVGAVRDVLLEAAGSAGLTFIDPIAEGWLSPADGLFADPVHPNGAGYERMGTELAEALRDRGL